jgi:hypothetical protein
MQRFCCFHQTAPVTFDNITTKATDATTSHYSAGYSLVAGDMHAAAWW